ncbi:MAG: M16 family metallopeptidase [Myxococcales bacterium]
MSALLSLVALLATAAPPYQQRVLGNGLTVLAVEDHALPLVTVEIGVRNGSMTESPAYNGLSHLYEHMFFKGNQVIPDQEAYLARTRELGMIFNGSTETERVNYWFTTTSDRLEPSLALMRDSIERPLFAPAELSREERVVVGEIDRDESDPGFFFRKALDDRLWKYPSYKDPLGNRETVLSATPEKMRTIQQRYYVPNNSVLVVAGDIQAASVFAAVERLFGAWPRAPDPFAAHPVVIEPPLPKSSVVVVTQPVQTVSLAFEWEGPSTRGDGVALSYPADLLTSMLEQPASRFQRDLVESGACVRADLEWYTQAYVGPITYGLEAAPGKVDACLRAALAELPVLAEPGTFSDQELKDGLTRIEMERALEQESPSAYSHVLTFWWSSTGLPYYLSYPERIHAVTRPQIADFLRGYVFGKPFVFGAMLSREEAVKEGLDSGHFEKLLGIAPAEASK